MKRAVIAASICMRSKGVVLSVVVLLAAGVSSSFAQVVYSNDFEAGAGPEWSSDAIETSPDGRNFLGQYSGSEMVSLTLGGLPSPALLNVSFDLYVINTWDGHGDRWGPDEWEVRVHEGPVLLHTTFSNQDAGSKRQAYPDWYPGGDNTAQTGAAEVTQFGYDTLYTEHMPVAGAVYQMSFTFAHDGESLEVDFEGFDLESNWWDYWLAWHRLKNESWGLDNVVVTVIPEPGTVLLLSLGGVWAIRRRG